MLSALEADGCWVNVDAVLTGYFASTGAVRAVAEAVAAIKRANPNVFVLVDPVLGDAGRLYIESEVAKAIHKVLLPLASAATPNRFELGWLTGSAPRTRDNMEQAARRLGPEIVVVTSAYETADGLATLLVSGSAAGEAVTRRRASVPHGAGDLFAALFLGHLLNRQTETESLHASLAQLDRVLAASEGHQVLQLSPLIGAASQQAGK
jgi:pyridoxine kinase